MLDWCASQCGLVRSSLYGVRSRLGMAFALCAYMQRMQRLALASCLMAGSAIGCAGGGVEVRTAISPDANFSAAHTFHFLPSPQRNGGQQQPQNSNDPMFENSITGQEVHQDITQALTQRGYTHQHGPAALSVAYYIGAKNKIQVTDWDYGYPFWGWRGWRWGARWGPWPDQQVTEFEEGTVVIDVLDSAGKKLLWRGVGKSDVPDDASDYAKALQKTVSAIFADFPKQGSRQTNAS
jgi:hypothetical protein